MRYLSQRESRLREAALRGDPDAIADVVARHKRTEPRRHYRPSSKLPSAISHPATPTINAS